jgi:GTP-binding protein
VTFAGSAASPAQFPRDRLPEVAFLGRSNVGKSRLLNALCGTKGLARVSSTPGRTRLLGFFRVGGRFYLTDLPGYGYARVPERERRAWQTLVDGYLVGREPLALCLFLIDARHDPMANDTMLRDYLDHHRLPYVLAATKADKVGRGEITRRTRWLREVFAPAARGVVAVSAVTGTGTRELWRIILEAAERKAAGVPGAAPPSRGLDPEGAGSAPTPRGAPPRFERGVGHHAS